MSYKPQHLPPKNSQASRNSQPPNRAVAPPPPQDDFFVTPHTPKKPKRKKIFSRGFKAGYFSVMSILLAAILVGLGLFWRYLSGYEKNLPENLARKIISEKFETLDTDWLYSFAKNTLSVYDTEAAYKAYITDKASGGEYTIRPVPSGGGAGKTFAVFAGSVRLAELNLIQSPNTELWELSSVRTIFDKIEDFSITVPRGNIALVNGVEVEADGKTETVTLPGTLNPTEKYDKYTLSGLCFIPVVETRYKDGVTHVLSFGAGGYDDITTVTAEIIAGGKLRINGTDVTDGFITRRGIKTPETDRLGLTYIRYTIKLSAGTIDLGVTNKSGAAGEMLPDGDGAYRQRLIYMSDAPEALSDFAKNATMTYARYGSNHATAADLAKYFDTQSETYKALAVTENIWFASSYAYSFKNAAVSEVFEQDQNILSCRVTLEHYINVSPTDVRLLPLDLTLFIRVTGGKYSIINLISNA